MYVYSSLPQKVGLYVKGLYNQNQNPVLLYHNMEHTEFVVQKTCEIASNYSFDEKEIFILSAAAWFHDTGQLFGEPKQHERRSVVIMRDYLATKITDLKILDAIEGCILATKMPQEPLTLLEQIICDADTFNLGTTGFIYTDNRLKKESQLRNNIPAVGWDRSTLDILTKHKYFTPYCQALLNKGKQENIEIVLKRIKQSL